MIRAFTRWVHGENIVLPYVNFYSIQQTDHQQCTGTFHIRPHCQCAQETDARISTTVPTKQQSPYNRLGPASRSLY